MGAGLIITASICQVVQKRTIMKKTRKQQKNKVWEQRQPPCYASLWLLSRRAAIAIRPSTHSCNMNQLLGPAVDCLKCVWGGYCVYLRMCMSHVTHVYSNVFPSYVCKFCKMSSIYSDVPMVTNYQKITVQFHFVGLQALWPRSTLALSR